MQFGFFVYLCAVFHNMVQGMYGLRKTGYVMVAALMVCAAAMSVIYQQDSETASSVPYRAYGCIAVISAASPAVEGSLELSTYFNTVTMSAGAEYRTVSSARTSVISAGASGIQSPGPASYYGQFLEAAPDRMSDYFVYTLERILI